MTGSDDEPPGLAGRDERRASSDDAAILNFDLSTGGMRPPEDPVEKVQRLVDRARDRHDAGEFQAAIALTDKALQLDPTYLRAWLWKAHCLERLRNLDGAIAELTRARRAVQRADAVSKVDEMLDVYRRRLTDRPMEKARGELRHGRPRQAVMILEGLTGTLAGDETFEHRLTYARECASAAATSRSPLAGSALTLAALQRVLAWLCREEMENGNRALKGEDYRAAAIWYGRARKRDERHTAAALNEARAVFGLACMSDLDFPQTWPGIREAITQVAHLLRRADLLAQGAAADRSLAEEAAALRAAVAELTTVNDARGQQADKIMKVNECIADFNALIRQFEMSERNWLTFSNLRTSFPQIEARAHRLFRKYGPDDADVGEGLASLHAAVTELRKNIRW
ncbi:tetratricopeptide repeat protein [Micromonospora sp. LA-10]|uniref:tetratricopeptide repeat protein n=1 Tax=Micromonospora sp. LA-10 TaxID=3446364 RepID=UPI003F72B5A8